MNIDCSLGEIESLIVRAGRGAGLSWGQAQDSGRAVVTLATAGLPSACWFAAVLPLIDSVPYETRCPTVTIAPAPGSDSVIWQAESDKLCPVALGCALADHLDLMPHIQIECRSLWSAALSMGFVAPAALAGGRHILMRSGRNELLYAEGRYFWRGDEVFLSPTIATEATIVLSCARNGPASGENRSRYESMPINITRCLVPDVVMETLNRYAQRICVLSTEATRVSGAGAGMTDND